MEPKRTSGAKVGNLIYFDTTFRLIPSVSHAVIAKMTQRHHDSFTFACSSDSLVMEIDGKTRVFVSVASYKVPN